MLGLRHLMLSLGFLANIISYTDRANISLAIVPMETELPWFTPSKQGLTMGAFFCGYACTQILGGWLSWRYGPKRPLLGAVVLWSVATLATPPAARSGSLGMLLGARAALGLGEGLLLPCLHDFALAWVPRTERATAAAGMTSGQFCGSATAMLWGASRGPTSTTWSRRGCRTPRCCRPRPTARAASRRSASR